MTMTSPLKLPDYTNQNEEARPVSTSLRRDEVLLIDQLTILLRRRDGDSAVYLNDQHSRSKTVRLLLRFAFHHLEEFLTWYSKARRS